MLAILLQLWFDALLKGDNSCLLTGRGVMSRGHNEGKCAVRNVSVQLVTPVLKGSIVAHTRANNLPL